MEVARGNRARARDWLVQSLALAREVTGHGVELVAFGRNLALVTDDPGQREKLYGAIQDDLTNLLGANHPDTLTSAYQQAVNGITNTQNAVAKLTTTCTQFEQHEVLTPLLPPCLVELGDLRLELGDVEGAAAAFEQANRHGASDEIAELPGYLLLARGDSAGALVAFDRALAAAPLAPDHRWYQKYAHAKLRLGKARALRATRRLDEAQRELEPTVELLRGLDMQPLVTQRRLGRANAELALVLAASGRKPELRREVANAALAWYRSAGGPGPLVAELELTVPGSP